MKRFNVIKTVQLTLMLVFLAVCAYLLFLDRELFYAIAQDRNLRLVCGLLWGSFVLGFVFIFLDFAFSEYYKRIYRELDFAVHSDPLSGLANRNSCDAMIEKYADKPLPKGLGCVMLELSSLYRINKEFSHADGNKLLADYSNILKMASVSLCFVGRNGGNRFLAIFEESEREQIDQFLERIDQKVNDYNADHPEKPIVYSYGIAYEEPDVKEITELVALSNRRIVH